ncbi:hypothetical protein Tco_0776418 [Tanacetum coccineum]
MDWRSYYRNGWDPLYTVWDKHGEPAPPASPPQATPTPSPLMSDMTSLLDDLSYIPPNNEHNEPIQEDIGETNGKTMTHRGRKFLEVVALLSDYYIPILQPLYKSRLLKTDHDLACYWKVYGARPEIDTYRAQFQRSYLLHRSVNVTVNNLQDPRVSTTSDLFSWLMDHQGLNVSNACVVDGVRYVRQSRDELRTTPTTPFVPPGPDGKCPYGKLQKSSSLNIFRSKLRCSELSRVRHSQHGRVKKLTLETEMTPIIRLYEWKRKRKAQLSARKPQEDSEKDSEPQLKRANPMSTTDDDGRNHLLLEDPANATSRNKAESIQEQSGSATQEEPSEIDTFYSLHTVNSVFQDPEALRMLSYSAPVDRSNDVDFMMSLMRSDDRFADAFARYDSGGASGSGGSHVRDSEGEEDGDDTGREDGGDDTIRSFPSDMSLGNLVPPWHQFLDQKIRGAYFSLGIIAGERFVIELTPSMFPQRHVAGDRFPQRHVTGEGVRMLLGKGLIT